MACKNPLTVASVTAANTFGKISRRVSCGRCAACRVAKRNEWIFRLTTEAYRWKYVEFVTLTYNDDYLPFSYDKYRTVRVVDGARVSYRREFVGNVRTPAATLDKHALQKFFKRFRKAYGKRYGSTVKYYAVGEYGSQSLRPHYHFLLFCDDELERFYVGRNKRGDPLFASPLIEDAWPIGFNTIDEATIGRIGYCFKYLSKQPKFVEGCAKQFSLSSQGLGTNWFTPETVFDLFSDPSKFYVRTSDITLPMPKYFKDLLLRDDDGFYRNMVRDYMEQLVIVRDERALERYMLDNPGISVDDALGHLSFISQNVNDYSLDTSTL